MSSKIYSQIGEEQQIHNGYSLQFNGTDSKIDIGSISNVKSISFWMIPRSSSIYILDLNNKPVFIDNNNNLSSSFNNPTYYVNNSQSRNVNENKWNHICITDSTALTSVNLKIGYSGSKYFTGSLTDIRLYDTEITSGEIEQLYYSEPLDNSEIFHATFCEEIGSILHDVSGNKNSGSITNSTWISQSITSNYVNWYGFNNYKSYTNNSYSWPSQLHQDSIIPADNETDVDVYGNNIIYTDKTDFDAYIISGSTGSEGQIYTGSIINFNESSSINPYEIQFFNKNALTDNSYYLPEFWRKEIKSASDYSNTFKYRWTFNENNSLPSSSDSYLNLNNLFIFGKEDIYRRLFIEYNSGSDNYNNLLTYRGLRTDDEIYAILDFYDNATTSQSVADWINIKDEAVHYFDFNHGIFNSGSNHVVETWLDLSKENWINLLQNNNEVELNSSSGLMFNNNDERFIGQDNNIDKIDFINDTWTLSCTYTPEKYSVQKMPLVYFSGSNHPVEISLAMGEHRDIDNAIAFTITSRSYQEPNGSGSIFDLYTNVGFGQENTVVVNYNSSNHNLTLNNYYNSSWNIDSTTISDITSSTYQNYFSSSYEVNSYSGSKKNIKLFDIDKDKGDLI